MVLFCFFSSILLGYAEELHFLLQIFDMFFCRFLALYHGWGAASFLSIFWESFM